MRFLLLILFLPTIGFSQWREKIEFGTNPGDLEMSLFLPKYFTNSTAKFPLVVALHGCSQNSQSLAQQSGWNELAEKHNFIVLYPDQLRRNNGMNCFNWFELKDITKNSGENGSIIQMINFAIQNFNIDAEQIFVYGLSAGAAMTVALMATNPEIFKSGAVFAGVPYKSATNKKEALHAKKNPIDLTPQNWAEKVENYSNTVFPKLLLFHGEKDKVVPIHYSYEIIDQWSILLETALNTAKMERKFDNNTNVIRSSYSDKSDHEKIVFYQFPSLKHEIAVDPGIDKTQGGKTSIYSRDIDFFSTYWVAKEFGLVGEF